MSKIMLKCFAVAFALGIFPATAFAEDATQPPAPYDGPMPAGGAMTPKVAAVWFGGGGTLVEVGAGVLIVGGLLVALSSHGKSTTSTTSTH